MTYPFAQQRVRFLSKAPKYWPTILSQVPVPRLTPSVTPSLVLRSSAPTTVVLPGKYLELDLSHNIDPDCTLAIEACTDAPSNKCSKFHNFGLGSKLQKQYLVEFVQSMTLLSQGQSDTTNISAKLVTPQAWFPNHMLDHTHHLPTLVDATQQHPTTTPSATSSTRCSRLTTKILTLPLLVAMA